MQGSIHVFEGQSMPDVCARCGKPAEYRRDFDFSGVPQDDVSWFISWAIGLKRYRARIRLAIPLCREHRNFKRQELQAFAGVLLATVLVVVVSFGFGKYGGVVGRTLALLAAVACASGLTWLYMLYRSEAGWVYGEPEKLGSKVIDLYGVAPEFAEAFMAMRHRETQATEDFLDKLR